MFLGLAFPEDPFTLADLFREGWEAFCGLFFFTGRTALLVFSPADLLCASALAINIL
jgi:hypothetical protein